MVQEAIGKFSEPIDPAKPNFNDDGSIIGINEKVVEQMKKDSAWIHVVLIY